MSAIKCCYSCPDRYSGCHAKCEKYQRERDEYERRKEAEKKVKERLSGEFDRYKYWR